MRVRWLPRSGVGMESFVALDRARSARPARLRRGFVSEGEADNLRRDLVTGPAEQPFEDPVIGGLTFRFRP